ncbi:MAG: arsenic efflux protein [Candidatus Goldbacteria bacterium]|nr:arsenic efflux protein [Candidatus Goldiibacteriota bacterium]
MVFVMDVLKHTLSITAFVFAMMLLVEYINVYTKNKLTALLNKNRFMQYVAAVVLGLLPGCLGSFAVVTLYIHGGATLGALVANMMATSGDEAFVMLAMIPKETFIITGMLFVSGIVIAYIVDAVFKGKHRFHEKGMPLHEEECICFDKNLIKEQWQKITPVRGILFVLVFILLLMFVYGQIGPKEWNYIRATFIAVYVFVIFVVATVPDHFLEEHLWKHVVIKHVPVVFLWTFGILAVMELVELLNITIPYMEHSKWIVLLAASLVGIIPESGPHLIFVMLYAEGSLPFSVLFANSIVQDGHGMLPLLAHSRKDFIKVKVINFTAALLLGGVMMAAGF